MKEGKGKRVRSIGAHRQGRADCRGGGGGCPERKRECKQTESRTATGRTTERPEGARGLISLAEDAVFVDSLIRGGEVFVFPPFFLTCFAVLFWMLLYIVPRFLSDLSNRFPCWSLLLYRLCSFCQPYFYLALPT